MFEGNPRQYPNLVRYLSHVSRRSVREIDQGQLAPFLMLFGAVALVIGVGLHISSALFILVMLAVAVVGWLVLVRQMRRKPRTQEEMFARQVREAGSTMQQCLEKRRLHRDLDSGSLMLLEECARYWSRIHQTLASANWDGADIPLLYRSTRDHALRAADDAMGELAIMFREQLPDQIKSRPPLDFVEEAVEKYVLPERREVFVSPAFQPARKVADKLRTLALEAENVSARAMQDASTRSIIEPGQALDASIGEMRSISRAEDELRQNLTG